MMEDIIILSLVFLASLAFTYLYVARVLRRMPESKGYDGAVSFHVADLPRPLETRSSVKVLQVGERIEAEEREVAKLLREIEDLEKN